MQTSFNNYTLLNLKQFIVYTHQMLNHKTSLLHSTFASFM